MSYSVIFYFFIVMLSLQDLKGNCPVVSAIDTSTFDEVLESEVIIDKTLFIKEFMTMKESNILLTMPRRWGKTSNLEMLNYFLKIKGEALTEGINERCNVLRERNFLITRETDFFYSHCGQYPVLYLSWMIRHMDLTFLEFLDEIRLLMYEQFDEHFYLLNSTALDEDDRKLVYQYYSLVDYDGLPQHMLEVGMLFLLKMLYKHFNKKVIVLIDKLDLPISEVILSQKDFYPEQKMTIIKGILESLLNDSTLVERSFTVGSLELCAKLLDGVNITHYPFLRNHQLVKYFGATAQEMQYELKKINKLSMYAEVEEFYGYRVEGSDAKKFSPWTVARYVDQQYLDPFWMEIFGLHYLDQYFENERIRKYIAFFVHWREITIEYKSMPMVEEIMIINKCLRWRYSHDLLDQKEVEVYMMYLFGYGYLSAKRHTDNRITLQIANKEAKVELYYAMYNSSFTKCRFDYNKIKLCLEAMEALGVGPRRTESFRNFTISLNNLFSGIALPKYGDRLQATLYFILVSKLSKLTMTKAEDGRILNGTRTYADILTTRKSDKAGIIIETKYRKQSAEVALQQILDKGYYKLFDFIDDYKRIVKQGRIYIGLHIDKDNKVTACYLVDSLDIETKVCI